MNRLDERARRRPGVLRWLVLVAGLASSVVAFALVRAEERRQIVRELEYRVDWRSAALESRFRDYEVPVFALARLISLEGVSSQKQFNDFSQIALASGAPIQRLTWFQRVRHEDRANFEVEQSIQRGFPYFVSEFSDGEVVRAAERPEYFPSVFEHRTDNVPAIPGFDPAFDRSRRAAMDMARDEGRAVSLQPQVRARSLVGQPTYIIFIPVYRGGGVPATTAERLDRLIGYVTGLYFVTDVLTRAMAEAPKATGTLQFSLYPKSEAEPSSPTVVYSVAEGRFVPSASTERAIGEAVVVRSFDMLDHRATMRFSFGLDAVASLRGSGPWLWLVAGACLTLLLFWHLTTIRDDLASAHAALVEAQRIGKVGHWEIDLKTRRSVWSENLLRLGGLPPMASVPPDVTLGHIHPDDRESFGRFRSSSIETPGDFEYEYRWVRPDGGLRWFRTVGTARRDSKGAARSLFGVTVDITEQKLAQQEVDRSHRQMRLIIDSVPVLIAYFDREHRYQFVNASYAMAYGRKVEEFAGLTAYDVIPPDRIKVLQPLIDKVLQGERQFYEHNLIGKDGTRKHFQVAVVPEHDEQGQLRGYIAAIMNVTELRRTERELEASRQRFDAFMQNSPVTASYKEPGGRMLYANQAYEKAFPFFPNGWKDKTDFERWSPEDATTIRASDDQALAAGGPIVVDQTVRHPDGPHQWVVYKFPFRDAEGRLFLGGMGIDVTEQKALEQQLRQAQKMEAVGQLTGGLAHDFNNLLAVVVGNLEVLSLKMEAGDARAAMVQAALDAAFRGGDLTHRLLSYSRRQALAPAALDLRDVVLGLRSLLERAVSERVSVEIDIPVGLPRCMADRNQLETALLNLAINARDAMEGGGRIKISAAQGGFSPPLSDGQEEAPTGACVGVSVADIGTGMSEEVRRRAIEPFFTTKEVGKGSGLGLSMVYGFARQSGGNLVIESEEGKGTRIVVELPLAEDKGAVARKNRAALCLDTPLGDHCTVLVVEDEQAVRNIAATQFRSMGFDVLEAADGAEAIEILKGRAAIDLMFTDIVLPGALNGIELGRDAQAMRPSLRILYTSGYNEWTAGGPDGRNAGRAVIAKPYSLGKLQEAVRAILDEPLPDQAAGQ